MTGLTATWKVSFGARRGRRPARTDAAQPQKDDVAEAASPTEPKPRAKTLASSLARRLALAHHIEHLVETGMLTNYADAARRLGVSRARLSQLLDLLLLSPELQARVLAGEVDCSERRIRPVAHAALWEGQPALLEAMPGTSHGVATQPSRL